MGSYLVIVAHPDRFPARIPVHVARNEDVSVDALLLRESEVPAGFVPVAGGPYGHRGFAGNATDWCLNDVESGKRRILRGGAWVVYGLSTRSAGRMAGTPARIGHGNGFRLAAPFTPGLSSADPSLSGW